MENQNEVQILTVQEAADFLRIGRNFLYQLKAANKVPYHKIGMRLVFFKHELVEWIASGASA